MASIISAGTTSGTALNMTADTSGQLQLATGASATTAVTIDTSQNVGIGTTTPTTYGDSNTKLAVYKATSGATYINTLVGTDNVKYATYVNDWSAGSDQIVKTGTSTNHAYAFLTNGTERMRIDSSGNVLINQTANTYSGKLAFTHDSSVDDGLVIRDSRTTGGSNQVSFIYNTTQVGRIYTSSSTTTYATSSDYRLKENVEPMTGALDKIMQLNPVIYKWKSDGSDGQGFIAHELQDVIPDCVVGEKDAVDENDNPKYQGIDPSKLVATLTKAIQELKAIVDAQQQEINALKGAK